MLGLDRIQHENRHTEAGFFDCPDSGTGLRPERETLALMAALFRCSANPVVSSVGDLVLPASKRQDGGQPELQTAGRGSPERRPVK
jgi:hypothetical protein